MEKNIYKTNSYFAAANGFDGFRSNFDSVFSPLELKKLFILKGGPGTGKSTLMKKVAKYFSKDHKITEILCSSDNKSLDGIIIEREGVKIGIADGTSPHVIEPKLPGAVEEIVNLGEAFDYPALMNASDKIKELSNRKGDSYKKAYSALGVAGEIYKYINAYLLNNNAKIKAESLARELTKGESSGRSVKVDHCYLISSFSKDGYSYLDSLNGEKEIVTLSSDGIFEYAVMKEIVSILNEIGAVKSVYPSPLSPEILDAIESDKRIYVIKKEGDSCIAASDIAEDGGVYSRMKKEYFLFLDQAQKAFTDAASYHFKLEDIYSKNISFEQNDIKVEKIIKDIFEVFNK